MGYIFLVGPFSSMLLIYSLVPTGLDVPIFYWLDVNIMVSILYPCALLYCILINYANCFFGTEGNLDGL